MSRFVMSGILMAVLSLSLFGGGDAAAGGRRLVCPDLSEVTRVGACPDEAELRHTFERTCTDRPREFQGASALYCLSFEAYAAEKNKALHEKESPVGLFEGYLSCGVAEGGAESVGVECGIKGCKVYCAYPQDRFLTLRTEERCHIEGRDPMVGLDEASCGADGAGCSVVCGD